MATWTFEQRGGDKTVMKLDSYAAPFGRARKDAIIKELIKVNVQTTNYPGSKNPPTRHVFGSGWEPTEIKGRWMTKTLPGNVSANGFADLWINFVRAEQPLTIHWGTIASWEGFISELELSRESEHEVAWRMTVLLDGRIDLIQSQMGGIEVPVDTKLTDLVQRIDAQLAQDIPGELEISIFDELDGIAGLLKSYTAQLVDYANLVDSIEHQSFTTIQSFRGVLANVETALATMQLVVANGVNDSMLAVRRTESDVDWYRYCLTSEVLITTTLALIGDLDMRLSASNQSGQSKTVTAQDQDTWESLSTRATGAPFSAGAIREANGIKYGQLPVPGETYIVL